MSKYRIRQVEHQNLNPEDTKIYSDCSLTVQENMPNERTFCIFHDDEGCRCDKVKMWGPNSKGINQWKSEKCPRYCRCDDHDSNDCFIHDVPCTRD